MPETLRAKFIRPKGSRVLGRAKSLTEERRESERKVFRTPNDQRSDVYNQTSAEHQSALDNKSRQLNPKDVQYTKSRGKK